MTQTALILGASGRFGAEAAKAFAAAGWNIVRFDRAKDDLTAAIQAADVVVNAWNPPDYSTWSQDMVPLHQRVIAAAKGTKATVILPGNVYVFGAHTQSPWSQHSPRQARNPLGRLRITVEQAYEASGVRTIILRSGDFLDTRPSAGWFDLIMIKQLAKGRFVYPGDLDTRHAWGFLPDIARAAVKLSEMRQELPVFSDIPFAGYTLTGREVADALSRAIGRPVSAKQMSWLPLKIAAPFNRNFRSLIEMRYLWNTAHQLDGALMAKLLPEFCDTPLDQAMRQAIGHLKENGQALDAASVVG